MKEQTIKDIQKKLADYRQPAPEISWDELEKTLAANKKKSVVPMWGKWLSAAAAMLLVAGIGWHLLKTDNHAEDVHTTAYSSIEHTEKTPPKTNNLEGDDTMDTGFESDEILPIRSQKNRIAKNEKKAAENVEKSIETQPLAETSESSKEPEMPIQQNQDEKDKQQPTNKDSQTPIRQKEINPSDRHQVSSGSHSDLLAFQSKNRLTAKVYMSNSLSGSNGVSSTTPMMYYADPIGAYSEHSSIINNIGELYNQQPTVVENADHHQPIRLGLSVRYQLDPRWSLEAGVSYTYLASDITRIASGNTYIMEQKLSYLGFPVNANYLLWTDRYFNIYVSAGTIVEKMVKGKRYNEDHVNTENVSIKPLQFSLNCAAGAEFKIGHLFSMYAEPGISYHIDNHSKIPTYYQDKPLGFNLNLGLRFNLNKE